MITDDPTPQTPPPQVTVATPASNQNLIIGLVLGAAILLLLFLVFNNQSSSSSHSNEVGELKSRIAALTQNLEGSSNNLGSSTNNYGVDPQKLAEEISTEANALAGLIGNFANTIRQKDALLQTSKDTEQLLNRRIQELQRQMNDLSSAAAESASLKQELESARTLLAAAKRQIEELRKRPDESSLLSLRQENEELSSRLRSLQDLAQENTALRQEVQRLRALLDRSTLFVENADALPAIGQRLFRELERLEGKTPAELTSEYESIGSQLSAKPLRSINFATGSSAITQEKIDIIKSDLVNTHPSAFLLIVGYASTDGDFSTNRKLSADRATAVASQVNSSKKGTQEVRAVFLNETNRFSREQPPLNRICEIWEIRP